MSALLLESPSAGIADDRERARRRAADEALATRLEHDGLAAFVEAWEAQPLLASQAALPEDARAACAQNAWCTIRAGWRPRCGAPARASWRRSATGLRPSPARPSSIAGALDPAGLARARVVAAGLPGAHLEIVGGAGHAPHLEQPEAFLALARHHLAATTSPTH